MPAAPSSRTDPAGWAAAAALAVAWGVGPLLPALAEGAIPGSPWTDLYPSVWGLGWFASHVGRVLPTFAPELAAPAGMPFYYSSPLHGWVGAVLIPVVGLRLAYALGVVAARVATVLCAYGAGRALGLGAKGGLVLAAVYGASPFFHGYAVEGIVEGTDGWTLALWVWMAARERWGAAAVAAALTMLSSWYLGFAGALVALAVAPWAWRASASYFAGVALASPAIYAFFSAFTGGVPLDATVRRAMGTPLWPSSPGILPGANPFAKTSWVGVLAPLLALASARRHPREAAGVIVAWVLSLGVGPWYLLPVWRSIRFPYRLHAATLLGLGVLAGRTADRLPARWGAVAGLAIALEGFLLSPIEPLVPSAPADVPASYAALAGKDVLAVPGPVGMPPGVVNRSRPRARYLLYWAAVAGTRTPWAFDFNSVGASASEPPVLDAVRSWDPILGRRHEPVDVAALRAAGVDDVVLVRRELGDPTDVLRDELVAQGATVTSTDDGLIVLSISP